MQATVVPGVSIWSVWQPDRNLHFNSFFIETDEGNLAVDPLPASEADLAEIERRGGAEWIAVTNRDHERDARSLAARFGAKIAASAGDAPLLSGPVDRFLADGDEFFGGRVVALEGMKTPGEFALHFRTLDAVLVGDALWGDPAGSLRLMPDEKLADPERAVRSLRKIFALRPAHVLAGDGASIFGGATAALAACLDARPEAFVRCINLDELGWVDSAEPAGFLGSSAEIGFFIGAERLGYRMARIPAGNAWCPNHWHSAEEELFVVFAGAPTLSTPHGTLRLRKGDVVAFPIGPRGAHRLWNDGPETAEVFMLSNVDRDDVCYYPDSRKLLVEARDLIVRAHPELDYWDGEA